MKQRSSSSKRQADQRPSAGPRGLAISPPAYGLRSLDNGVQLSSNAPIQRRTTWAETTVKNMDLVDTIMAGADFGFTAIIVNGQDDDQANPLPLREPDFGWSRSSTGQVELRVTSEAQNDLGTRMQIPTDPPWQRLVSKSDVGNRLYGDARVLGVDDAVVNYALDTTGAQTNLIVKGNPDDGALARLTKTHEKKHVADDKGAKEAIVDPWDRRIATKRRTGPTLGATPMAALQQFYTDVGGTGADIGLAYMNRCANLGTAFHHTDEGSKPKITSIRTAPDESWIEAHWKHPVEEGLLSRLFG